MGCPRIISPFLGEGNDEMNVVTFSLKNLKRRKMRTTLAILGIALGVVLITSLPFIMDGLESSITGHACIKDRIKELFSIVGLGERMNHKSNQLSVRKQ
jgi:hypothetical protein